MSTIRLSLFDNVSPMIKQMINDYPRAVKSGLSGVGYFFRQKIMEGIKSKAPAGERYPEHSVIHKERLIDNVKKNRVDSSGTITRLKVSSSFQYRSGSGLKTKRIKGEEYTTRSGKKRRARKRRLTGQPVMMGRLRNATKYQVFFKSTNIGASSVRIGWFDKGGADKKLKRSNMTLNQLGNLHETGGFINVTPKMKRLFLIAGVVLKSNVIRIPARPTIRPIFRMYKNDAVDIFEANILRKWINTRTGKKGLNAFLKEFI
jgi:hypothetical protein